MGEVMLKIVYTFLMGLMLASAVNMGVEVFYSSPEYPEFSFDSYEEESLDYDEYDDNYSSYQDNVTIISLVTAAIFVMLAGWFKGKSDLVAQSFMTGALFTFLYISFTGIFSPEGDSVFYVMLAVILALLYAGYKDFKMPKVK